MLARSKIGAERPDTRRWFQKSILLAPLFLLIFCVTLIFGAYGETQLPHPSAKAATAEEGEGYASANASSAVEKGNWVGIFVADAGQFELRPCDIQEFNDIDNTEDARSSGTYPLFLFKSPDALRTGLVEAWFNGNQKLAPGKVVNFQDKIVLKVEGKRLTAQLGNLDISYSIHLTDDRQSRLIFEEKRHMTQQMPSLIWAGDLDRDGDVDLVLNLTGAETGPYTLFLSGNEDRNGISAQTP